MKTHPTLLAYLLLGATGTVTPLALASAQPPLDTAFQYQGQLRQSGAPATGSFDLEFSLFDSDEGGVQLGPTVPFDDIQVLDGLFTAEIDFGSIFFNGQDLWLEIAVRAGASSGAFTVLSPRQKITATPYALHAASARDSDRLDGLDASDFLHADGSVPAGGLVVEGSIEVDAIVFPDGTAQTTAATSALPTVTVPTIYTPASLTCEPGAEANPAQWAAIALGTFRIAIDGIARDIAVNFSSPPVVAMDEVASRIEDAVRASSGGTELVHWQVTNFSFVSGDTTSSSSITPLSPHSGGLGIDISGAGLSPWTNCNSGTVTGTKLNTAAYSGYLVKLNSEGEVDPAFIRFPGTLIESLGLHTICTGVTGSWSRTFSPPIGARYGLVYAFGTGGVQGQQCGLNGIIVNEPGAVLRCRDTGNVSQYVDFSIGWGTCSGTYNIDRGTTIHGEIHWYR